MEELKLTISRSYSEKVNMGNYETQDFFCARSLELPADLYNPEELDEWSANIHKDVMLDVKRAIEEYKKSEGMVSDFDVDKVEKTVDNFVRKIPMTITEFQEWTPREKSFLNTVKKLYNRVEANNKKEEDNA